MLPSWQISVTLPIGIASGLKRKTGDILPHLTQWRFREQPRIWILHHQSEAEPLNSKQRTFLRKIVHFSLLKVQLSFIWVSRRFQEQGKQRTGCSYRFL